ncbi:putative Ig domain-containing protein [Poseidonibacter lekithochrous]|uniref:putative Ig domain-containing protein n=1 Tax=Poseidonibacter lekithochrous TaxID=1904463 RepID=UPI000D35685C|nr:putative Ig domain-containing protein [Poseidonibacter lekithochrous]
MASHVKNIILSTVVAGVLVGCGGGGGSSSSSSSTSAGGGAQKGPFKQGQTVTATQLNSDGTSTTTSTTTTTDSLGKFNFSNLTWSGATEFKVEGEYLDENTGQYIAGGLLTAVTNVTAGTAPKVNINILTHIAASNIKQQMANNVSIDVAKANAKKTVAKVFKINLDNTDLESLDITNENNATASSEEKAANTQLLKISAALLSTEDPEETLKSLATDLSDGKVDDEAEATFQELKEKESEVKLSDVAKKMKSVIKVNTIPDNDDFLNGMMALSNNIEFIEELEASISTQYESNTITVSGINGTSAASISISGAEFSINGGTYTDVSTTISNNDNLTIRATSSSSYDTLNTSTVTIGGVEFDYDIVTESDANLSDTKIKAFDFVSKIKQALSTSITSDAVEIEGINEATAISIANGTYEISTNGGTSWSSATSSNGTINDGDLLRVTHSTSANYKARIKTVVTFGSGDSQVTADFKSYTLAQDKTPEVFTFATKYDVAIYDTESPSYVEFDAITIAGVTGSIRIRVNDGEVKVGSGEWRDEKYTHDNSLLVANGETVTVRHKASSSNNTKTTSSIGIGTKVAEFISYTELEQGIDDTYVEEFLFEPKFDVSLNSEIESDEITISGIDTDVSVSVEDGEYSINSGAYTNVIGTISNGDTIKVKHTSSEQALESVETTLKIGEYEETFISFTKAPDDITPHHVIFNKKVNQTLSTLVESDYVFIRGINAQAAISISGNGSPEYNIGVYNEQSSIWEFDTNSWTSNVGTINDNTAVKVRHTSSDTNDTETEVLLSVGESPDGHPPKPFKFITKTVPSSPIASIGANNTPAMAVINGQGYSFSPKYDNVDKWEITNKPEWASFNKRTGELKGRPNKVALEKTFSNITIKAINGGGETVLPAFTIEVTGVTPTLTVGTVNSQYSIYNDINIQTTVTDIRDDTHTFSFDNRVPSFLSINNVGLISANKNDLSASDKGTYIFNVIVTDSTNKTASKEITFDVIEFSNVATPPIIVGNPVNIVNEDNSYSFTPTASDINSANLTYSITNKPSWATFNTASGELSGTPVNEHVGVTNNIIISVTEGSDTVSLPAFNLTVNNVNDNPTISGTPVTTIAEDSTYSFIPNGNDVDANDTLTYSITNKPTWATFNTETGALTGTPANADVGITNDVVISVTDNNSSPIFLVPFNLEVTNVNDAPTVKNEITDITVEEDTPKSVDLKGNFEDIDVPDTLTYNVTLANEDLLPSWMSLVNGVLSINATNTHVGEHLMKATAMDSSNVKVVDEFKIIVRNVNNAPTTSNTSFSIVNANSNTLSDNLTASDIDSNTSFTYSLVSDVSNGTLSLNSNGSFEYTPNAKFFGSDVFTFKANDGLVDSNVSTVTINVTSGTALNTDVDEAMKKLESIEPETENIDTKLAEVKTLLNGNTTAEGKILVLMIEMAEALADDDVSNILTKTISDSTIESTSTLNKIIRAIATDLVDLDLKVNNSNQETVLSDTVRTKLNDTADKLKTISSEFGNLFTSSTDIYEYDNDTMSYNDSLALRAGILSFAAQLKNLSSYQWGTDEDFHHKVEVMDRIEFEYNNFSINPAKVLESGNFFKLDSNVATTRLSEAKQNLLDASSLLSQLPLGYSSDDIDNEGLTQKDKDDIVAVSNSLGGTSNYKLAIDEDDEIKEVEFDLSKIFDASTAVDITSLGSSWQALCNKGNITRENSVIRAGLECRYTEPFYGPYGLYNKYYYNPVDLEPQVKPTADNSKIDEIVRSITKIDNTKLTGDAVLNYMFESDPLTVFGTTWTNVKSDAKYLVAGNNVKVNSHDENLEIEANNSKGIDSRAEAKKNFSTAKSEIKAKIRLKEVDSTSSDAKGPVGRGSMIAFMNNINAANDNIMVKVELRPSDVKYRVYKYDSTWANETEIESGKIATVQTVYNSGSDGKLEVSVKSFGSDIKINMKKLDGSNEVIETFTEKTVSTDESYDLGIDQVRFRSELKLAGDDGTLYNQVYNSTKLRVHSFTTSTPAPLATLSSGDTAILTGKNPWFDVMKIGNGSISLDMYDKQNDVYQLDETETLSINLTDGTSNFEITQSGDEGTAVIKNTEVAFGYTNLFKSDIVFTNTVQTTESDEWSWTGHNATDLDSLVNVFTNGNTHFQDANTTFMLKTGGNVVLGIFDGKNQDGSSKFKPSTNVVGSWTTESDKIKVDLSANYKSLNEFSLNGNKIVHGKIHQIGYSDSDFLYTGSDAMKFFYDQTKLNVTSPLSGKVIEADITSGEKVFMSFLPTGNFFERGYNNGTLDYSCYGMWKEFSSNVIATTCDKNDIEPTNSDSKISEDKESRVEILSSSTIRLTVANNAKDGTETIDNITYTANKISTTIAVGSGNAPSLVETVSNYKVKAFVDTSVTSDHTGVGIFVSFTVNNSESKVIQIGSGYASNSKIMLKVYDSNDKLIGTSEYKTAPADGNSLSFGELLK